MKLGILDPDIYQEVKKLIKESFIKEEIVIDDVDRFMHILSTDKKVKNNTVYLILLERLSHLRIQTVELDQNLENLFAQYLEKTHGYYSD